MNPLPKNQAEYRQKLYKTHEVTAAMVSRHPRRKDNVRLNAEVKGRVKTRAGAGYVSNAPEKTGMYEKPACGILDTQRYLVQKRKPGPPKKTGSLLSIPEGASPEEKARLRKWVAHAAAISTALNS